MTAKPSSFHDLTSAPIIAGVAKAGVDLILAVLSVKAGGAVALVVAEGFRATSGAVSARKGVTGVAFGQNLGVRVLRTDEVVGRRRHYQLVSHRTGLVAPGNST